MFDNQDLEHIIDIYATLLYCTGTYFLMLGFL